MSDIAVEEDSPIVEFDLQEFVESLPLEMIVEEVRSPGYPDRLGNYSYTHTGRIFFPCDPRPEEVFAEDLIVPMARLPRFGGNTIQPLMLTEHLYHCSYLVPEQYALEALLHDAAEAYIGDLIRPIKKLPLLGTVYLKIEEKIEQAIAARFNLTWPWPIEVMRADEIVLRAEIAQNIASDKDGLLFNKEAFDPKKEKAETVELKFWQPMRAELEFRHRFSQLLEQRGMNLSQFE